MVRPCLSIVRRLVGRSIVTSPIIVLPSVTRAVLRRKSTTSHSLTPCPYPSPCSPPRPDLTPSDAQRRTIYALSTPPGKGGVAVIRVSGPDAAKVWKTVTRPLRPSIIDTPPTPRIAELRHVIDPITREKLDDGLILFFKGESPGSPIWRALLTHTQGRNRSRPKMSSSCRFTLAEPYSPRSSGRYQSYRIAAQHSRESLLGVPLEVDGWI